MEGHRNKSAGLIKLKSIVTRYITLIYKIFIKFIFYKREVKFKNNNV